MYIHHLPVYHLARICSDHTHLKDHRSMHPGNSMRLVTISLNDYISLLPSQEVRGIWCRSYLMCILLQQHWVGIFTWNNLWWLLPTVKVSSRRNFLVAHPGSPESWMMISLPLAVVIQWFHSTTFPGPPGTTLDDVISESHILPWLLANIWAIPLIPWLPQSPHLDPAGIYCYWGLIMVDVDVTKWVDNLYFLCRHVHIAVGTCIK